MAPTITADDVSTYERERGKPMPSFNHSLIQSAIIAQLWQARDRFTTHSELTLDLGGECFTPDLAVYAIKGPVNWTKDTVRMTEPPLLVVEILSPTQGSAAVLQKIDTYLANGVKSCWLVIPPAKVIVLHAAGDQPRTFSEGSMTDPATGITIDLAEVFRG